MELEKLIWTFFHYSTQLIFPPIFFTGKSTLAALLLRLYDPDKGQIIIENHDIKLLDLSWLRKQIGTVTQEPILFSSTIRDNISYGADNPEAQML